MDISSKVKKKKLSYSICVSFIHSYIHGVRLCLCVGLGMSCIMTENVIKCLCFVYSDASKTYYRLCAYNYALVIKWRECLKVFGYILSDASQIWCTGLSLSMNCEVKGNAVKCF